MATAGLIRVNGRLRGRKRKDLPAMTGIDGMKPEDFAQECTIGLGIFAVDDNMDAIDHEFMMQRA